MASNKINRIDGHSLAPSNDAHPTLPIHFRESIMPKYPSAPSFDDGVKAIEAADCGLLKALLGRGLSPNAAGGDGCFNLSLLGMACHHGDPACVEALLSSGADASVVDDRDFSTLFLYAQFTAPESFREDVCLALMEAGADPLRKTGSGDSAISRAAEISTSMAEKMARSWSQVEKTRLSASIPHSPKSLCRTAL